MAKEKEYTVEVRLTFDNAISATSKEEAKAMIVENFKQDFNLDLSDNEIKVIENNEMPEKCGNCGETGGKHSDDACEPHKEECFEHRNPECGFCN